MKIAQIERVPLSNVDNSPFRSVDKYPYVQRKIDALMRSIAAVGLWPGAIGRRRGNRIELAFGHHRGEAARRSGLTHIDMIVEDLSDEQMLQYMGRENMEDYNADFLIMLETWEAAAEWTSSDVHSLQPIVIAKLLGWTQARSDRDDEQMNNTAVACNSAHQLLRDGHIERDDLHDMTVQEAREILTRASANIKRIEDFGKAHQRPAKDIEAATKAVAKAIKSTADEARAGTVAKKDLRGQVDVNAYKHAQASKVKGTPLFSVFGKQLAVSIERMLKDDVQAEKLDLIVKALPDVVNDEDVAIVRRLSFNCGELSDRASRYQRKLERVREAPKSKVVAIGRS